MRRIFWSFEGIFSSVLKKAKEGLSLSVARKKESGPNCYQQPSNCNKRNWHGQPHSERELPEPSTATLRFCMSQLWKSSLSLLYHLH